MTYNSISRRSILILLSHLLQGLPGGLLLSGLHTETLYVPLLSSIGSLCPAQHTLVDLITRIIFSFTLTQN